MLDDWFYIGSLFLTVYSDSLPTEINLVKDYMYKNILRQATLDKIHSKSDQFGIQKQTESRNQK